MGFLLKFYINGINEILMPCIDVTVSYVYVLQSLT